MSMSMNASCKHLLLSPKQYCARFALSLSSGVYKFSFPNATNVPFDVAKRINPLRESVIEQGNHVRALKASKASQQELSNAIAELKSRKQLLEKLENELCASPEEVDKAQLDDLIKQRFFFDQSFAIYGGMQGLYDFGPAGCALKANLLQEWRRFFVLSQGALELDSPCLTPAAVLRASGHVDRFTDYLVADSRTGETFRADHLVRRRLETDLAGMAEGAAADDIRRELAEIDQLDGDGLQAVIDRLGITAPDTGNALTPPRPFNLMLETSVGAASDRRRQQAFLRPETAQGIFANFRRLLAFHRGRLPMAVAQVGPAFRNEIAPRSGLLRVREFALAEIEHFYDPADSRHPGFASIADVSLPLLSAADQQNRSSDQAPALKPTWRRTDEALADGLLASQTQAFYLARTFQFLTLRCGLDRRRLRLRQHPVGERAHYASDCWDVECLLAGGGWVECVGVADRGDYDLLRHAAASGERMVAERRLGGPTSDYPQDSNQLSRSVTPHVLEPSFGVGRLLTAVLEHNFRVRSSSGGGRGRSFLSLPAWLAPYACAVVAMSGATPEMTQLARRLADQLAAAGLSHWMDADDVGGSEGGGGSVSVGRRYARADQLGVPFAATVDFDSVAAGTVTLRERDSMQQVRLPVAQVPQLVQQLVQENITWTAVMRAHAVVQRPERSRSTAGAAD